MKKNKFQKFSRAYIIPEYFETPKKYAHVNMQLLEVYITDVKGSKIAATRLERFGCLTPAQKKNIVYPQNKVKGKEVPFEADQLVSIREIYKESQLMTLSEAKFKMIEYIVHDFKTEDEINYHAEFDFESQ